MMAASKLPIDTVNAGITAMDMADLIFGNGVIVNSATYTGDPRSAGIYEDGDSVSPGATPSDTGIIMSTGRANRFTNANGQANQRTNTASDTNGVDDLEQLNIAAGVRTFDASILDVDFTPDTDKLTMQFVFSSEEYLEFENSIFQDFVGVWVNGTLVEMEVGNGDIDPGNVNTTNNINMYVNNQSDVVNTEMDGLTITLTLTMNVNPNEVNSLRIAIGDGADSNYDSNVLIAADSVQTDLIAITDTVEVFPNSGKIIDVLANDLNDGPGVMTIIQINGQDVIAGDTITLPTGQTVLLNADATLTVTGDDDVENFNFTYTIDNGTDTDVGFVNATSVPCFVAGTLIATPEGERPAETLSIGDLVETKDDGPQPVRWIGSRQVAAQGDFAPIHIRAGTFGPHGKVRVSPLHRVLIRDQMAELLFGESEVLVAARDLVNDHSVRRCPGGVVTYVHLLFDRHQVVYSDGLATESFLPGPQTTTSFEPEILDEICALFPEIDRGTGLGYSAAARRTLKRYEAELLRTARVA